MAKAKKPVKKKIQYDCADCSAYCCTYEVIPVTKRDLERLAKGFGITPAQAEKRYTKVKDGTRCLRHKEDKIFPTACQFLDQDTRRCTNYEHRPAICRAFPEGPRCHYYDFMIAERELQGDDDLMPIAIP